MILSRQYTFDDVRFFRVREFMDALRNNSKAILITLLLSLCASIILVLSYGNIFAAIGFVVVTIIVAATLYRIEWGFFIFIGLVLSMDQFIIPEFDPLTLKISYFRNLKEIPYLPSFDAGMMNPLELQLVFIISVWFVVVCFKRERPFARVPVWWALLIFFLGVIGSMVFGLVRGGEVLVALWEVRALFYFATMFILVPQIIQTKKDLTTLVWVFIGSISFKAFQGIERFVSLGLSFRGIATLTNHEDPLFMVTLIFLLLGLVLFNSNHRQRGALVWLLFPLLMGIFVAQRRAVYAALATSFITFTAFLGKKEQWILFRVMGPIVLGVALYSAVFWESESRLASPVRLIKSALSNDKETAGERYYSNLYREFEKFDLAFTVKYSPMIGMGFGNKYFQPIPLAKIAFPLREYIPHNEVLWIIVKMGTIGFFLFLLFVNCFGCYSANVFSRLNDPYLKSICVVAIVAIVGQITVSYYDLQLTYYRNMIYLGTLMGIVATLDSLRADSAARTNNTTTV